MGTTSVVRLASDVIDQIAAGEVVERPASVVKELVENAIDAAATQVTVDVLGAGVECIRIADNGVGMSEADADLCLLRHATSKLTRLADLGSLSTFGFRGEALAAIASVSRLQLTTRWREGGTALSLQCEGGRVVARDRVGAPFGTEVVVRDLFYNVPARRKFLKAPATELGHVVDALSKQALAHPGIHFRLTNEGKTCFSAPIHKDRWERATAVLRAKLSSPAARASAQVAGVSVQAFLGAPGSAQATSRATQLFVGNRPIRDRGLLHAVTSGYGDTMAPGRYPVAVVFVDLDSSRVDINVHPQKLEVRFSDPQAVYAAVRYTIRTAVEKAAQNDWNNLGDADDTVLAARSMPIAAASGLARSSAAALQRRNQWRGSKASGGWSDAAMGLAATNTKIAVAGVAGSDALMPPWLANVPVHQERPAGRVAEGSGPWQPTSTGSETKREWRSDGVVPLLRHRGTVDDDLWVCESDGELWILDRHVALEVVLHQSILAEGAPVAQRLAVPVRVSLGACGAAAFQQLEQGLAEQGLEGRVVDDGSVEIFQAPAGLSPSGVSELVCGIAKVWQEEGVGGPEASKHVAARVVACQLARSRPVEQSASDVASLLLRLRDAVVSVRGACGNALALHTAIPPLRGLLSAP